MQLSKIKDHFNKRSRQYDSSACWVKDDRLLKKIYELAATSKQDLVLDVATGTGVIGEIFLDKVKGVVGLDVTREMYEQALKRVDFIVCANAEEMPFCDEQFNLVIVRQGLQFMNAQKAVNEMFRVCKTGGRIMLIQLTAFDEKDREYAFKIQLARQPVRENCFLDSDLVNLLENAGCKNIQKQSHFSHELVGQWIDNGALSQQRQETIRSLYEEAPKEFKKMHEVKFEGDEIIDKMKIAIVWGKKPA